MLLSQKLQFLTLHGQKGMITVAYIYIYIIVAIGELVERYGRDALDITGPRAVSISILDIPRVDRSRTFSPTTQSALKRPRGVSQTAKMGLAVDSSRLLAASLVLKLRCH